MNDKSSEHESTEPERREWDTPELQVIAMREALGGSLSFITSFDAGFGYS
jgi:hypothetical protein